MSNQHEHQIEGQRCSCGHLVLYVNPRERADFEAAGMLKPGDKHVITTVTIPSDRRLM